MNAKALGVMLRQLGVANSDTDKDLVYVTPEEEALLKRRGGSGRVDPVTGLQHYDEGTEGGDTSGGANGNGGGSGFSSGGAFGGVGEGPGGSNANGTWGTNNGTDASWMGALNDLADAWGLGDLNTKESGGAPGGHGGRGLTAEQSIASLGYNINDPTATGPGGRSATAEEISAALEAAGRENAPVDPNDPNQRPTELSEADQNQAALSQASQDALGHATQGNEGLGQGLDQASPGEAGANGWTDTNFSQAFQSMYGKENANLGYAKSIGQMLSALGLAGVPGLGALGTATSLGTNLASMLGYGNYNSIANGLTNSNVSSPGHGFGFGEGGSASEGQGGSDSAGNYGSYPGEYNGIGGREADAEYGKPVVKGGGPGFSDPFQALYKTELSGKAPANLGAALNQYLRLAKGPDGPLTSGLLKRDPYMNPGV